MQKIKFNGNIDWAGNATSKRTKKGSKKTIFDFSQETVRVFWMFW